MSKSVATFALLVFFFSIAAALPPKLFDVTRYGAVADGRTDNAKAFLNTWNDACKYNGRSRIWVPRGTFLLRTVRFMGRCNGPITFIIKGTLQAPSDLIYTDTWIGFRYVDNLTVKGGGYLDGQGQAAWLKNDCQKNHQCGPFPVSIRFDFVTNSRVQYLRSLNPKNTHFNLFACDNLNISYVRLSAPVDSPNTDGIRIGSSKNIKIFRAVIGTGDDCVSMVAGSQNIDIQDVTCGPGHGISIGSLGRTQNESVTGVKVRNCTFIGTQNGVRIKTWAPSSYSLAENILFENIIMKDVQNPIFIDQQYCPFPNCYTQVSSKVQIRDVTFRNIWGVSSTQVAVRLQCSGINPCKNVKLINIDLAYHGPGGGAKADCANVFGSAYGRQNPGGCL